MNTQTKSLLLIYNPKAGRSKPRGPLFDALAVLSEGGYLIRIHRTTAAGDAAETAARAAMEGAEATKQFTAKFGRAKSYGEQTIGTPDAGAVSMALFFQGLAQA